MLCLLCVTPLVCSSYSSFAPSSSIFRVQLPADDTKIVIHLHSTDVDIFQDIIQYLNQRQIGDSNTIIGKVFGHSGDSVHEGADLAAVTGASTELEENEKPCYSNERQANMCFR